jgi:uncharacterized protein
MKSHATVRVQEAERLARQMGRHFGHKVDVEEVDGRTVVRIPAGTFSLEPRGDELIVAADAPDTASLERVQEVCGDHLERFAHADLAIEWARAD